jgi:hypothetical protein
MVTALTDTAEKVSKPMWQLIIDTTTGMQFSAFHKNKDGILDNTSA